MGLLFAPEAVREMHNKAATVLQQLIILDAKRTLPQQPHKESVITPLNPPYTLPQPCELSPPHVLHFILQQLLVPTNSLFNVRIAHANINMAMVSLSGKVRLVKTLIAVMEALPTAMAGDLVVRYVVSVDVSVVLPSLCTALLQVIGLTNI